MLRKIIGYQITNGNDVPNGLWSFQVFRTKKKAENYFKKYNLQDDWTIQVVRDGDVEEPTFI